ncbi:patatin-like phospholipase family protein [Natroniella acetigena]|nr:patatin-like phospholipase family protein [Natroniella acetigena]
MKALEEKGIPIDLIVGTSMGSIVGTMYGSGLSIAQIEELVTEIPFENMFDLNLGTRESLLTTYKVNQFLEEIAFDRRLEKTVIPTALLSYDLTSGTKFIHTSGNISEVIQSSYAIPYYFPPYQFGNRFLIDPGIVEITPVKAAKALGSDFVIGTISFEKGHDLVYDSPSKAINRFMDLVQQENTDNILEDYADVLIEVDVSGYTFTDFDKADRLIEIGYLTTKEEISNIKKSLSKKNISLQESKTRDKRDLSLLLNDLEYDRLLIDKQRFRPLFYYGRDQSSFKQDLFRSEYHKSQFGFELNQKHLDTRFLVQENINESVELDLRWKKLSQNTDLKSTIRGQDELDNTDWKLGIKYYADNYTWGLGRASFRDEDFNYLDNKFNLSSDEFVLQGESNLLIEPSIESFKVLHSLKGTFNPSRRWTITSKLVYNDTLSIESPIIYRGLKPDKYVKNQYSLEFGYNYRLVNTVDVIHFLQLREVKPYLFFDYEGNNELLVSGIGVEFNLNLLGLKPLDFKLYTAYDEEEEFLFGLDFNFNY